MKRNITNIGVVAALATVFMLGACRDYDTPDVSDYKITSDTSVGEPNLTISELKSKYSGVFSQSNAFVQVEDSDVVEGVVVANDNGGNLYQTLVLAHYISDADSVDVTDCIVLAVKNTCLYPYFGMGQMVRVNLRGLYVGCYSKLPKIGQPYYTSSNNLRLGPMLFELCKTKVQLIGSPADYIDKIKPIEIEDDSHELIKNAQWYQNYSHSPMLVRVKGTFSEADGEATFAPYDLRDAGYGVDRTLKVGKTTITVRTSTQNDVSFLVMPKKEVKLTGVLSYYSGWQLQLRSVDDMEIAGE
jgi:hypothetical protein